MTLFNGLKTILLVAMYLGYDRYRIICISVVESDYQIYQRVFFNLYVWLIRTTVLYDVCYTLLSLGHFHPYVMRPEWFYDIFMHQPQLTF